MSLAEFGLILASAAQSQPIGLLLDPRVQEIAEHMSLTPAFLTGSALLYGAAVIRGICYRHLGRYFTFELALRKDHKLITTGPYAVVRHPSYTGSLMYIAGSTLIAFGDKGSLWAQLGQRVPWLARPVGAAILILTGIAVSQFVSRTKREDKVLRTEFGDEWVRWSKKTPYRLIPYIF